MALSGSFSNYPVTASYGSFGLYCEWSGKQNVAGNYTDVTLNVYVRYYNLNAGARDNSTASINGTKETYTSPAINHYPAKDTYKLIKTYTVRVHHDSDGTKKSCSLSASWQFNGTYSGTYVGTITASTTVTLDTIARASEPTVSASSVYLGNAVTINTNRKSSGFTHTISIAMGGKTIKTITGVGASTPWTPDTSLVKDMSAESVVATITCTTYNGTTPIGSAKTCTVTVKKPNASAPTVSASSVKMGNSVTVATNRQFTYLTHYIKITLGGSVAKEFSGTAAEWKWDVSTDLAANISGSLSGKATVECTTYCSGTNIGTKTCELTLTVPDATVPTLSKTTVDIGSVLTINMPRKAGNFKHTLEYSFGGEKMQFKTNVDESFKWSVPYKLASQIPSSWSGVCTIYCYTYNGAKADKNLVGTNEVTVTLKVPDNSTTKPKISGLTLTPSHSLPSQFADIFVQGLTKVAATYTAEAPYSSVKSVTMTAKNNYSPSLSSVVGTEFAATSGTISVNGDVTVTVTVTNARGTAVSSSMTVYFYEYSSPELVLYGNNGNNSLLRCDADGKTTETGLHLKIVAGRSWSVLNGKNLCDLKYRCKVYDGLPFADEEWIVLLEGSDSENEFNGVATKDSEPIELASKSSYLAEIQVIDTVGNRAIFTKFIPTCEVAFFLAKGGKGASFGKYPEGDGLEVAWKTRFYGDVQGHVLGLSGLPAVAEGANIDTYTAHGVYAIPSNDMAKTMTNLPLQEAGTLRVYSGDGKSKESGAWVYTIQEYINCRGRIRFTRFLWTEEDAGIWNKTEWMSLSADEVGTSGIWTYIKRVDGTAECWARRNVTVDTTGQWGQLYSGGISSISLPFTFLEPPVCTVTVEKGSSDHFFFVGSNGRATTTEAPSILIFRPASSTGININVLYSVHGRWK